jgi:hypothetical protein
MDKFLKVFIDDLNIHNMIWEDHLEHLWFMLKLREVNLNLIPTNVDSPKLTLVFWIILWIEKGFNLINGNLKQLLSSLCLLLSLIFRHFWTSQITRIMWKVIPT